MKNILTLLLLMNLILTSCTGTKNTSKAAVTTDERGFLVQVGDKAPNFEMKMIDGTTQNLSDLKGKVVVLQFTASWCKVCREEMPHLEKDVWQMHKEDDFILIGIDKDEPLEKVTAFINQTGVSYPIALDPGSEIFGLFADKQAGVTRNIVIDKKGKIVFLTRLFDEKEFDEMKNKINSII